MCLSVLCWKSYENSIENLLKVTVDYHVDKSFANYHLDSDDVGDLYNFADKADVDSDV